ncbi:MAG: SDR family oxidoreductase [Chitinophagales bacterium]
MPSFFDEKIVWITGASSGIGEALAYELSRQGAKMILSARNENELNRVKSNCKTSAENIFVLPLDLTAPADIQTKATVALSKWNVIDYLIHNAGIAARDLVERTDMLVIRTVMETNYFGPVALTKAVLPSMLKMHRGNFVVVSSLSAKFGVPKLAAYAGSKHALHGFFESLRVEVEKDGIGVSFVIPGFINTPILKKAVDGKGKMEGKNLSVNEQGMSTEECALRIVKAIKSGRRETLIGRSEKLSVFLHRFFPNIFYKALSNHPIKKLRRIFPRLFK